MDNPLEIIELAPENVVVVWCDEEHTDTLTMGSRISAELRGRGFNNLVVSLHKDAQIDSLDPAMMARHGWVRKAVAHGAA